MPPPARLPNPKAQPYPSYFECKILFFSFSLILAYTRNLTPSEGNQPTPHASLSSSHCFPLWEQSLVISRIPRLSLLVYGQDFPAIDIGSHRLGGFLNGCQPRTILIYEQVWMPNRRKYLDRCKLSVLNFYSKTVLTHFNFILYN